MTTNQETYHDNMLEHLYSLQREVNHAINIVREIERNGERYKATEKTKLVGVLGAFGGHPSG